jgi:HEAT repeat protein
MAAKFGRLPSENLMQRLALLALSLVLAGCGPTVHYPPKDTNPAPATTAEDKTAKALAVLKSSDADARRWAAVALGDVGAKQAVQPLIGVLKDSDVKVRRSAAQSLGKIGPDAKEAIQPLISALSDSDKEVKSRAAWALGEIGIKAKAEAKAAIPALSQMFKGQDFDLKAQAGGALKKIDPEAAYEAGVERP